MIVGGTCDKRKALLKAVKGTLLTRTSHENVLTPVERRGLWIRGKQVTFYRPISL